MSEHKTLGAKEMFRQSIIYLYNSYRENGMKAEDARIQVSKDIEEIQSTYIKREVLPKSSVGYADPKKEIDDLIKSTSTLTSKAGKMIYARLQYIRSIMG